MYGGCCCTLTKKDWEWLRTKYLYTVQHLTVSTSPSGNERSECCCPRLAFWREGEPKIPTSKRMSLACKTSTSPQSQSTFPQELSPEPQQFRPCGSPNLGGRTSGLFHTSDEACIKGTEWHLVPHAWNTEPRPETLFLISAPRLAPKASICCFSTFPALLSALAVVAACK